MPFFLDGNPTPAEISEAVNYVLANLNDTVVANQGTGQIVGPSGDVTGYLYKYISIKYADSFDGTLNFSNTPTNRLYYGIRNSDSSVESTNPADYVWNNVTGGFGTTKFLWYLIPGGRQISFQVSVTQPNPGWEQDAGVSIDLDYATTSVSSPANFVVIRVANDSSAPTNAEVLAAIGREPIDGDLCTVNYNSGISSIVYKYTTGWAVFQRYITGDLIVANTIVGNNIAANTITGNKIAAATISANNMAANSITAANAAIADAAITTAKIGTAQVDFLQIAGQAVSTVSNFYSQRPTGAANTTFVIPFNMAHPGDFFIQVNLFCYGTQIGGDSSSASIEGGNMVFGSGVLAFGSKNLLTFSVLPTGSYTRSITCTGTGGVTGWECSAIVVRTYR